MIVIFTGEGVGKACFEKASFCSLICVVVQEVEVLLKPVLATYDMFDPKALKPMKDKDTIKQGCLVGEFRNQMGTI